MRLFLARLIYVAFCVGGMIALGLGFKWAIDKMEPLFLYGFLFGMAFTAFFFVIGILLDKREREGRQPERFSKRGGEQ